MRKVITRAGLTIPVLLVCGAMALPSTVSATGDTQPFKIKGSMVLTPVDPVAKPGLFTIVDIGQSTYFGRYL